MLAQYFEQEQIKTDYFIQEDGNFMTITYLLGQGEWARNTIHFEADQMIVTAWNSLGNTTMDIVKRFQEGVSKPMEEIFPRMLRFWGFLLEQKPMIEVFLLKVDATDFGGKAHDLLKKSTFIQLNTAQMAFIKGHYGKEVNWLGRLSEEDPVTKSVIMAVEVTTSLQQKCQQDPTIESNWAYGKQTLHVSYRGRDMTIATRVSGGSLLLTWDEQTYVVSNKTEANDVVETLFQTLEANQTPSTRYYEAMMKGVNVRTSYVPRIHEQLLTHYTWLDIETFAAKRNKCIDEAKKDVLYSEEMKLMRYINHFLVLDYETNDIAMYTEKEQAIATFKEHVLQKKEQKLTQQIKQFLQETKKPD